VNEWIFHDIRGENGWHAQERAGLFLQALKEAPDRVVVQRGSRWTEKAWALWRETDARVQVLSKFLYLGILIDAQKCVYLGPDQVQDLPPDLAARVPADDIYLFQAALAGGANIIVTTDERLVGAVEAARDHGIQMSLRDVFMAERYSIF